MFGLGLIHINNGFLLVLLKISKDPVTETEDILWISVVNSCMYIYSANPLWYSIGLHFIRVGYGRPVECLHLFFQGSTSYVPQEAWIQNATVKNNILFGRDMNMKKYEHVLSACALGPDLSVLPSKLHIRIHSQRAILMPIRGYSPYFPYQLFSTFSPIPGSFQSHSRLISVPF